MRCYFQLEVNIRTSELRPQINMKEDQKEAVPLVPIADVDQGWSPPSRTSKSAPTTCREHAHRQGSWSMCSSSASGFWSTAANAEGTLKISMPETHTGWQEDTEQERRMRGDWWHSDCQREGQPHTHSYTHTHTHTHYTYTPHKPIHAYIHPHTSTHPHVHIHIHTTHTYIYTHHTHTYTYVHTTHIHTTHTHIHSYTPIHIHTHIAHMHTHMYAAHNTPYTYTHIHTHTTCTPTQTHTHTHRAALLV